MDKKKLACPCGLYCGICIEFKEKCKGKCCNDYKGDMFYGECKLYKCCVNEKGLEHCGLCKEFPCEFFKKHYDPAMGEEKGTLDVLRRIKELKKRTKIGTEEWVKKFNNKE